MLLRHLAPLLVLTGAATAASEPEPCTLTDSTGYYDLRPLQRKGGDYKVTDGENGAIYSLNFCGPIVSNTWAIDRPEGIGGYFEGAHGGISLGAFNTTPSNYGGNLAFTYRAGSTCPNSSSRRGAVFLLQCDNSWSAGEPVFVGSVDECSYFFTLKTPHACPTSIVAGVWSAIFVFFSFLLIAGAVSLASAVAYNRYVLHQRGTDQLPSISRVRDGLTFAKDMFIISGIWFLDVLQSAFTKLHGFRSSRRGGTDYSRGAWSRSAADGFDTLPPGPSGILGDDSEDEEEEVGGKGKGVPVSGGAFRD